MSKRGGDERRWRARARLRAAAPPPERETPSRARFSQTGPLMPLVQRVQRGRGGSKESSWRLSGSKTPFAEDARVRKRKKGGLREDASLSLSPPSPLFPPQTPPPSLPPCAARKGARGLLRGRPHRAVRARPKGDDQRGRAGPAKGERRPRGGEGGRSCVCVERTSPLFHALFQTKQLTSTDSTPSSGPMTIIIRSSVVMCCQKEADESQKGSLASRSSLSLPCLQPVCVLPSGERLPLSSASSAPTAPALRFGKGQRPGCVEGGTKLSRP